MSGQHLDLAAHTSELRRLHSLFRPLSTMRYNLDGFLTYIGQEGLHDRVKQAFAYNQFFDTGAIETVDASLLANVHAGTLVDFGYLETNIRRSLIEYLNQLRAMAIPTPVVVFLSLLGVKEAAIHLSSSTISQILRQGIQVTPIDRDNILLPEGIIIDYAAGVDQALRPIFDALWRVVGLSGSFSYDTEGKWTQYRP